MAQYGAGIELAAQCPRVAIPDGWRPWTDADGPVPDALAKRAQALANDASVPLGATESFPIPGVTTLIRIEPRTWSRNGGGELVQGCFRVGGIYIPANTPDGAGIKAPEDSGINKAVGWLTAGSLVIGITTALANWGKS